MLVIKKSSLGLPSYEYLVSVMVVASLDHNFWTDTKEKKSILRQEKENIQDW